MEETGYPTASPHRAMDELCATMKLKLSDNSRIIFEKRYCDRDADGQLTETVEEAVKRVADCVSGRSRRLSEGAHCQGKCDVTTTSCIEYEEILENAIKYYILIAKGLFMPNSPTFTGAGRTGQLAACFVLPITDDMGRDPAGIMMTLRNAALIQQTGGGNGFSFSRLRQKGAFVNSSSGTSTGPIGFKKVYDVAFGMIAQGGTRRGANMGVLRIDHPDIEAFVKCKADEKSFTNFNISVGITDEFMDAVKSDDDFDLIAPHTKEVIRTVRARYLLDLIATYAHRNGEPGMLFLDEANRHNPVPHLYELETTNPCGEQWLGPYENCCLGSINLARHLLPDKKIDWDTLKETCRTATEFLENVVTENAYVPAVPQLKEAAFKSRRIGLGIMGLADAMYHVGVRYGSKEAEEFAGQVMEFVRYHAMLTSIGMSKEYGPFPAIKGSIFDPDSFTWRPPTPLNGAHTCDFSRPACDWDTVTRLIKVFGIRNACLTTIAPTGTIASVAGCEGYGCEPVFALAYYRHVNDNGKDLVLTYVSPMFEEALDRAGIKGAEKQAIIEKVAITGSCQDIDELPRSIRDVFVVSADLSGKEHVRMQASMQAFVDNSLSKTCNLPKGATKEDVLECYMMAWELGCKGITVYVEGSRNKVVLETKEEADRKKAEAAAAAAGGSVGDSPAPTTQLSIVKAPRPEELSGKTKITKTPLGEVFVTLNFHDGEPFEVFINTGKAGSETAAICEAYGRFFSYVLRTSPTHLRRDHLRNLNKQFIGIGGSRSGIGKNKVLSTPDAVGRMLDQLCDELDRKDLEQKNLAAASAFIAKEFNSLLRASMPEDDLCAGGEDSDSEIASRDLGDEAPSTTAAPCHADTTRGLCPECGEAEVVYVEGCNRCLNCGWSMCG